MPNLIIKKSSFNPALKKYGSNAFANKVGLDRTHIWRILNGKIEPQAKFIAGVLNLLPNNSFYDFFEVQNNNNHKEKKHGPSS